MEKLLLIVVILFLLTLLRCLHQDFFSPAVINLIWNVFFLFFGIIVFGRGIEWKYGGIIWILISCIMFLLGQIIGSKFRVNSYKKKEIKNYNYVWIMIIGMIVLGCIDTLIYLRAYGYSIKDLFNIHQLLKINAEIAYDRYFGHQFNETYLNMILSVIIYMAPLCGGFIFPKVKKRTGQMLSVLTVLPIITLAIVTNGKVGVIACSFLWAIGWLLGFITINSNKRKLNKKIIFIIVSTGLIAIFFLDFTMLMRIGSINMETQLIVNQKLQEYAFGQINAFTVWFHNRGSIDLGFGSNTYMFIVNWLGINTRKQGVYDLMPGLTTNIYTQNRGIITDFGVIGGVIYWFIFGVIAGVLYKKVTSCKQNNIIAIVILGTIYFSILYGFIISPWIYSSYVLAFVGFGIFLTILKRVRFNFTR